MRLAWGVLALVAGCVSSSSVTCERDGQTWVCPGTDHCDPVQIGCVTDSQLRTCVGASDGTACSVDAETAGKCVGEVCEVSFCGDGFVVAPEQCDGSAVGTPHSCLDKGYYDDVNAGCTSVCTYDYSACTGYCGDGTINGPELCDGAPPERTCADLGYAAGFLDCTTLCGPDFAGCRQVNWIAQKHQQQMFSIRGASDSDVWAVGGSPIVLHWDGVAWQQVDLTSCVTNAAGFRGAFSFGGGEVILSGGDGTDAFVAKLSGTTCTKVIVAAGGGELADVWASAPDDIYAVSNAGIYHYDGASWTQSHSQLGFSHVWGSGAHDIYAAGGSGLWHYDGTNWTQVTAITLPFVYSVTGNAANDVYAVATDNGGNSDIYHWNGAAWTTLPRSPSNGALTAVAAGSRVIAGTYNGVYEYDGTTWVRLDLPAALDQVVVASWAAPNGDYFAVDSFAALMLPGAVRIPTQFTGTGYRVVSVDPNTAYAITASGLEIFDGKTWTEDASGPVGTFYDLWVSPTGTLWLPQNFETGSGIYSYVPGSPNGTYTLINTTFHNSWGIWGTSDTDMWLLTLYNQELRHFDGVNVDDPPCATCVPGVNLSEIWGVSSTSVYAVGDSGTIVHWGGSAWAPMTTGTTAALAAIWGTSDSNIYVAGDEVMLHYNGSAWSAMPAAPGRAFGHSLHGTGDSDIFVSTTQGLYHYDGTRWSPVRTGLESRITSIGGSGDVTFFLSDTMPADLVRLVRTIPW